MNIAIVDDLSEDRASLRERLRVYAAEKKLEFTFLEFESGDEFVKAFLPGKYSLVFLDMFMPGMTGMEAAKEVYAQDKACKIIFLTTSTEYSLMSYSVHAVYYLVKPVQEKEFLQSLEFCQLTPAERPYITVNLNHEDEQIYTDDIIYIDYENRQTRIHLVNGVINAAGGFAEVTKALESMKNFIVCYRGIMVNMAYIRSATTDSFVLKNGETLPLRQREKIQLRKAYMNYLSAKLREQM